MGVCGLQLAFVTSKPCVRRTGRCVTTRHFLPPDQLRGLCSILYLPRPANATPDGLAITALSIVDMKHQQGKT
jgi:hypothetical protein